MKTQHRLIALVIVLAAAAAATTSLHAGPQNDPQQARPGVEVSTQPDLGQPAVAAEGPMAADSAHYDVKKAVEAIRKQIAGRENAPAESVYKNIQVLKKMPAGRLLGMMENGMDPALGVNCLHCHVDGKWDSDEKRPKKVARDMFAMVHTINDSLLTRIPNLQSQKPAVNCTTCHRGQVKPATSL
jgi:hypothetical protein